MTFKPIQPNLEHAAHPPLSDRVLAKITSEHIAPAPYWQFWLVNYGVWLLWVLSVIAGAVAVAVMIYVFTHVWFALYEATHETALAFFVEVLPYLWVLSFVALAGVAYFNLRHTRHGYRYPFWQIILSSLLFSLFGGALLHAFGVGYLIDTTVGRKVPAYTSMERAEMRMWQMPEEGRLVGVFASSSLDEMTYKFTDVHGATWQVDITELRLPDRAALASGQSVRVVGTTTETEQNVFHACGVFPWMFDQPDTVPKLAAARTEFITQMHEHFEVSRRFEALEDSIFGPDSDDERERLPVFFSSLCAQLPMMQRFRFSE